MMNRNMRVSEIIATVFESLKPAATQMRNRKSAVMTMVLCLWSAVAMAQSAGGKIEDTQALLDKWVETKRVISQETRDWTIGKELINDRIELVQREIDTIDGKMTDAKKNITEADKNRDKLIEDNEKLKKASLSLNEAIVQLEGKTKALLKKLPDPIRERIKPLSQRLPEKSEETKLTLSERFQNIVGILNEINKFNREITTTSEVRTLDDGRSAEVSAMYVGISQAYFVGAGAQVAGSGNSAGEEWVWSPANEIAQSVADAIAIIKNEKVAMFVQLPVKIQ